MDYIYTPYELVYSCINKKRQNAIAFTFFFYGHTIIKLVWNILIEHINKKILKKVGKGWLNCFIKGFTCMTNMVKVNMTFRHPNPTWLLN